MNTKYLFWIVLDIFSKTFDGQLNNKNSFVKIWMNSSIKKRQSLSNSNEIMNKIGVQ